MSKATIDPKGVDEAGEVLHFDGEMCIMDETGDTRLMWSQKNKDEVDHARKRFEELKAKGYMAYTVNAKGDQGEVLHSFDAAAERIIMVPRVVGG